jgi:hypothetical protein
MLFFLLTAKQRLGQMDWKQLKKKRFLLGEEE